MSILKKKRKREYDGTESQLKKKIKKFDNKENVVNGSHVLDDFEKDFEDNGGEMTLSVKRNKERSDDDSSESVKKKKREEK